MDGGFRKRTLEVGLQLLALSAAYAVHAQIVVAEFLNR